MDERIQLVFGTEATPTGTQPRSHATCDTRLSRHIPATEAVTGIRCLLSSCDPEAKEEEGARRDTNGLV